MARNQPERWVFARLEIFPLWQHFIQAANTNEAKVVNDLVEYAATILERYVETFPIYTVHNHLHAENMVRLMGDLLGPEVGKLSVLESAMLIVGAYFHDIGMVYTRADLKGLAQEPAFDEFLDTHPEDFVKVRQSQSIPSDVATRYCRWRHADRVFVHLNKIYESDPSKVQWGSVSLRDTLGELCRSHVCDVAVLKDDKTFSPNFLNACDIRFCALVLRLADILDFDRSRSPQSVYGLLDLEHAEDVDDELSDTEWKKHLCATGFGFDNATREPNYTVAFVAGPKDPAVEYDVNRFLDVIEGEFARCSQILPFCSDRWRSFVFPARIDRSNIISDGYKYGEYRFTLDQQHVLNLFMGENLYDEPYVFVRELLQNAIDTTRHRVHRDHSLGHSDFQPDPIHITEWRDTDGYQWVRVDDFGMGMTEDIILKFMLRVGKSYYKSPEFEAEKLRYVKHSSEEFTPISRFGIGLLSCFIVCDRLEINTWHAPTPGKKDDPIRLSLPGLHGFYKLQTGTHVPSPMPSKSGDEKGYRTSFGTSVAVRIDPTKETGAADLPDLLERLVLCPPVPVHFEGQPVGGDPAVLIDRPWIESQVFELTNAHRKELAQVLDWEFKLPVRIHLMPLDLTAASVTTEFKGQLAIAVVDSKELTKACERVHYSASLGIRENELCLRADYDPPRDAKRHNQRKYCDLGIADLTVRIPPRVLSSCIYRESQSRLSWVSHNGIAVPLFYRQASGRGPDASIYGYSLKQEIERVNNCGCCIMGLVTLSDSLRPDLSIARDAVRALPWRLRLTANLAVRQAIRQNKAISLPANCVTIFNESLGLDRCLLFGDLLDMTKSELPHWKAQDMFETRGGLMSVETMLQRCGQGQALTISGTPGLEDWYAVQSDLSFMSVLRALMVQCYLNAEVVGYEWPSGLMVTPASTGDSLEGLKYFPPLFFARYRDSEKLSNRDLPLNAGHPFSLWLIRSANALQDKLPGILDTIRRSVSFAAHYWHSERRQAISVINTALKRVRDTHDAEITPPPGLQLREDDFER